MAKKRSRGPADPQFHATSVYKRWVWSNIKARNWRLEDLEVAMKSIDPGVRVTTGGLSLMLGAQDDPAPPPSNTHWMPVINRVFGLPPPTFFDPTEVATILHAAVVERWSVMTQNERAILLTLLGLDPKLLNDRD